MRNKRVYASLTIIAAIAVVIAIVLVSGTSSGGGTTAGDSVQVSGATTVQRRNLVETDTESGTISYAGAYTVYDRLSGTVTWLPGVGAMIRPGQPLFRVDNKPVILMSGSTPAFRNLDSGDGDGPDILELNRNLVALGFDPDGIVVDDEWQPATTMGVEDFQASLGEAQTGSLSLGQVVFLPGAQLVSTVDGTTGGTGGGAADTDLADPAGQPDFVSLTTSTTTTASGTPNSGSTTTTSRPTHHPKKKKSTTNKTGSGTKRAPSGAGTAARQELEALIAALKAELAAGQSGKSPGASASPPSSADSKPSSSDSKPSGGTGGDAGNATAILQTTSDHLIVTVDLAATSQSEAVKGEHVDVEMPAGNFVRGVITQVSSVAQSSSSDDNGSSSPGGGGSGDSGSSTATIPVTIRLLGHVSGAGLDQAAVSVNFAEAKASNVLSVPVTALLATGGDSYAVQEAAAPHKLIPVTLGLFAAGDVQISGAGIYPGLRVTDSQG